jgi:uncharacterized protein (TIGR02058 family)
MSLKRIILELGHGNDMHGGDYTKAALRAVQDCIHHSSLIFLRTLQIEPSELAIEVTIGVQKPEMVDTAKVVASLPDGKARVKVVKGGLDVPDDERGGASVIATAGVAVRVDEKHLGA